jgi:hypothetical protein
LADGKSLVSNASKSFGMFSSSLSKVEVLQATVKGKHLVIPGTLTMNNQGIPTHAVIDCRVTGIAFIDQDFTSDHQIAHQDWKERRQIKAIHGRPVKSDDIAHTAKVSMAIRDHKEQQPMFVSKLDQYPIHIAIFWVWVHDEAVCFVSKMVMFDSQYSTTDCHNALVTIVQVTEEPPEPAYPVFQDLLELQIQRQRAFRSNMVMCNGASRCWTVKNGWLRVLKLLII